ncbi:MAG: PilW family protein [Alcanivoracaceae bacterium]|nr:PilW family protein [Alcanivoracaceae bacterium]
MSPRPMQKGFSLVELMISLTLGTLVTMAAISMFSTNQRTFTLQRDLSEVQEQGRFALDYIARDLREFKLEDEDALTPVGAEVGLVRTPVTGITIPVAAEGGLAADANDRLTYAFHGFLDCEGDTIAGTVPGFIVNSYWVDADGDLRCIGSVNPATTGITLLSDVSSFQVLYGIDAADDGLAAAGRYVPASSVAATDQIVAIKVAFAASVPTPNPNDAEVNFQVLDKLLTTGTAPLDFAESRVVRLFSTTVKVRNFNWESI